MPRNPELLWEPLWEADWWRQKVPVSRGTLLLNFHSHHHCQHFHQYQALSTRPLPTQTHQTQPIESISSSWESFLLPRFAGILASLMSPGMVIIFGGNSQGRWSLDFLGILWRGRQGFKANSIIVQQRGWRWRRNHGTWFEVDSVAADSPCACAWKRGKAKAASNHNDDDVVVAAPPPHKPAADLDLVVEPPPPKQEEPVKEVVGGKGAFKQESSFLGECGDAVLVQTPGCVHCCCCHCCIRSTGLALASILVACLRLQRYMYKSREWSCVVVIDRT
jgi:hypothetical protein